MSEVTHDPRRHDRLYRHDRFRDCDYFCYLHNADGRPMMSQNNRALTQNNHFDQSPVQCQVLLSGELMGQYWLTPPDLYAELDREFHFDFDPCPYPYRRDGISIDWGKSNYVNPPFRTKDSRNGHGPTAFVRKAIEEHQKGKISVLTIPTPSYVNMLLSAGAEARSLGRVRWLETTTKKPMPAPVNITAFILRGAV